MTWWCAPIDAALNSGRSLQGILSVSRMEPQMFLGRGVAPIGSTAFAFVLGATVGIVLRRTIPAMALTLGVFVAVQIAMPVVVRSHLAPIRITTPITRTDLRQLIIDGPHDPVRHVRVDIDAPGAWVVAQSPENARGKAVGSLPSWAGDCAPTPGRAAAETACFARLASEGYRQRVTYQPQDRYWSFQVLETAVFLALTGLLALVAFRRIRLVE